MKKILKTPITNEDLKFKDVKQKIEDKEIKEAIIINPENAKVKIENAIIDS